MIAWPAALRISPLIGGAWICLHDSANLPPEVRALVRALLTAFDDLESVAELEAQWRLQQTEPLTWEAIAAFRLAITADVRAQLIAAADLQVTALEALDTAREAAVFHGAEPWSGDAQVMLAACLNQGAHLTRALTAWHLTESLVPTLANLRRIANDGARNNLV